MVCIWLKNCRNSKFHHTISVQLVSSPQPRILEFNLESPYFHNWSSRKISILKKYLTSDFEERTKAKFSPDLDSVCVFEKFQCPSSARNLRTFVLKLWDKKSHSSKNVWSKSLGMYTGKHQVQTKGRLKEFPTFFNARSSLSERRVKVLLLSA